MPIYEFEAVYEDDKGVSKAFRYYGTEEAFLRLREDLYNRLGLNVFKWRSKRATVSDMKGFIKEQENLMQG